MGGIGKKKKKKKKGKTDRVRGDWGETRRLLQKKLITMLLLLDVAHARKQTCERRRKSRSFFFENNCRESRGDSRGCRRKDTAVVCLTGSVLRRSLNAALPPHIYKQPENLKHYLTFHTPYLSNYGFFFSLKTHTRQSPTPDACMCTNATQSTGNNMNDEPFLGHCSHSKAWSAL